MQEARDEQAYLDARGKLIAITPDDITAGIWAKFDFRGIPAMIMFKDGQEIHRVIGFARRSWWPNSRRTSLDDGA